MKKSIIVTLVIILSFVANNMYINWPRYILNDTAVVRQFRVNDVNIVQSETLKEVTALLQSYQFGNQKSNLRINQSDVVIYNISFMFGEEQRHLVLGDINVIYESSDRYFEVFNGDQLQDSLAFILSESNK